jgi:AcrR family transcriptional regulator
MSRAQRRPRAERRAILLDSATEAIRRHGPGASMTQIAAAAGVTKPILYRYFGDRDGLVLALADRFAADLMSELSAALRADVEPRAILVSTVDAYVGFIERDPSIYRFLVQHAHPDGELLGFMQHVGVQVAAVLGQQFRANGHDDGGAEPIAHGIVGMVHAAGHWWVERQTVSRSRLVEYLADLLWGGLVQYTANDTLTESRVS